MASWYPRVRTTVTREWVVPIGASGYTDHAQLLQAIHAAKVDRLDSLGLPPDAFSELYDNHVLVRVEDEAIVVYYELPTKENDRA